MGFSTIQKKVVKANQDGNNLQKYSFTKGFGKILYAVAIILLSITALCGQSLFSNDGHQDLLAYGEDPRYLPLGYLLLAVPGLVVATIAWLAWRRPGLNLLFLVAAHYVPYVPFMLIGLNELSKLIRKRNNNLFLFA